MGDIDKGIDIKCSLSSPNVKESHFVGAKSLMPTMVDLHGQILNVPFLLGPIFFIFMQF